MPNYRRPWVPGCTYFFTVNLMERHRALLIEHVDELGVAFRTVRLARPFEIVALVVLPEHLHCIWCLPASDDDNALRWSHIKSEFSRQLPRGEWCSPSRVARRERGIWQRRYWERLLRDERDLRTHVDYVHYNPVKHGLVERVADWPYSTFHRYVRDGLMVADWGISAPRASPASAVRSEPR